MVPLQCDQTRWQNEYRVRLRLQVPVHLLDSNPDRIKSMPLKLILLVDPLSG